MGPKHNGVLLLAAAMIAGEIGGVHPRDRNARKRSQKGRKRGFKARQKKGRK